MADEQAGYALIDAAWPDAGSCLDVPSTCSSPGSAPDADCAGTMEEGCGRARVGRAAASLPAALEAPGRRRLVARAVQGTLLVAACLGVAALASYRRAGGDAPAALDGLQQKASSVKHKRDEDAEEDQEEEEEVREVLLVTSPGGQKECEGTYVLQPDVQANGKPTWKKKEAGVPRTIYFSNTGVWMVDNNDALKQDFDCAIGYLHAPKDTTASKMPWELENWERYDNDAEKWIVDPDIEVKPVLGDLLAEEDPPMKEPSTRAATTSAPPTTTAPAEDEPEEKEDDDADEEEEPEEKEDEDADEEELEDASDEEADDDADEESSEESDDEEEEDDVEGHGPCNAPGEDCRRSKCCREPSQACFEKNEFFAMCRESCTIGMVEENDEEEFRTPWSCYTWGRPLPPPPPESTKDNTPQPPGPCKNPSKDPVADLRTTRQCKGAEVEAKEGEPKLLCYAVTRPNGDEFALMQAQISRCAGVFSCDSWLVYSGEGVCLNPGDTAEVETLLLPEFEAKKGVAGALTATWVNTEAFMAAWARVIKEGGYEDTDWVVKLDPDAVFLPGGLRRHLVSDPIKSPVKMADQGKGVYLRNCRTGDRDLRMFGSIEVMSTDALSTYKRDGQRCKDEIDYHLMGEDMWLQTCLELLGVQPVEDYDNLLADGYCPGSATACTPNQVAFHPFKLPAMWESCLDKAMGDAPVD